MFEEQSVGGNGDTDIWRDVPEPQPLAAFIVDPTKGEEFTVVAHKEVGGYDVAATLYGIDGVWRVTILDEDDHPEIQSAVFNVIVDRRYHAEDVRQAAIKLLTNLYAVEA